MTDQTELVKVIANPMAPSFGNELEPMSLFDIVFGRCHGDSLIAIGSRRPSPGNPNPHPKALAAVPVRCRQEWLPGIFEYHVEHTQYFIPNPLVPEPRTPGGWVGKQRHNAPRGVYWFGALNENVRELSALVVDLDCYDEPLNMRPELAIATAQMMVADGDLPAPAMAAYTGSGALLLWLLRGEDDESPPQATEDNKAAWELCASAMVKKLSHIGGDPNARRLANWYKRAGTVDTKTGNLVRYWVFGDSWSGFLPSHRLTELQELLGAYHFQVDADTTAALPLAPHKGALAPYVSGRKKPSQRKRQVKLGKGGESARKRVLEIERLNVHREGFQEKRPSRRVAAWLYYLHLRAWLRASAPAGKQNEAGEEACKKTINLAKTFRPPLTAEQVIRQIREPKGRPTPRYFRKATMAEKLGVTAEEAEELNLEAIAPPEVTARQREAQRQAAAAKAEGEALYRQSIEDLLRRGLKDAEIARRVGVNRSTILRHRRKLGLRRRKPRLPY